MAGEKTVFISYRRTSYYTALALFNALTARGWDAFFDFEKIGAGSFEQIILSQIRSRAGFVLVLESGTLPRVAEPDDWVRREIETAIDEKRNIVPLTFDDFDWKAAAPYLTGKLAALPGYNALSVPRGYFDPAIDKLISADYLGKPLAGVLHPAPRDSAAEAARQQQAATTAAAPTAQDFNVQETVQRAIALANNGRHDDALALANEAIRLAPGFAGAYQARAWAWFQRGQWQQVIADSTQAILLYPNDSSDYVNRGWARYCLGDPNGAILDYNAAITLMPNNAIALNNRGLAFQTLTNHNAAIYDFNLAIGANPMMAQAYFNRGNSFMAFGNAQAAGWDYEQAIRLAPGAPGPYAGRASLRYNLGDRAGAIRDLEYALTLDPSFQYAREWLMRLRGY